ncbi:PREDICTED: solute carrier family 15 member 1 isoform X2 [Vollenhovia emeryi]|uniref:solute carrier family 15 member 1 isoform X2 n=1 Tax=Vollenhovia emeryi TaxID=411798 RepID=UPI0005F3B65D|nr:PREDICTED: solute carrier family 15 member 1 isoform X2 [Vollenhovia emeryi]
MVVNKMHVRQKPKYPKSVFFIISNEFCERFCYYGMRTVLSLYLYSMLKYSESTSTIIYHVFTCFVYFFPLIGAIISDSWLGKFYTIFYLSIIYAIGQVILSLSAAPPVQLPAREFSMLGLFLIALGTGGIKPCVSAFGGDQFILPQQERQLAMFFSLFYFSINTGSLISTLLTPVLREVKCFGTDCYFVAFLVPAVLMVISIVIFVSGKVMYKMVKPTGNLIVTVTKCVCHAIANKFRRKANRDHWLDHADDVYDNKLIEDIKVALRVLKLFIPLPIFWALYDQQGSQWTFQATRMDGQMGSFILLPDQLQALNPLLIIIFIPIFETLVYPAFAKIHFIDTPLKKLVVGGFLASVAFVAAGIVEIQIEYTYPKLPTNGNAQMRIFNTMNCTVNVDMANHVVNPVKINPVSMSEVLEVKANETVTIPYTADFTECYEKGYTDLKTAKGEINGTEAIASSWVITPLGLNHGYEDMVDKPEKGTPMVRGLIYLAPGLDNATLIVSRNDKIAASIPVSSFKFSHSELHNIESPGEYDVYLDKTLLDKNVVFKSGGVFTVVGSHVKHNGQSMIAGNTITVTPPNSLHMAWMLPQYIIITMAEVMFSVTGLQFAFTQAPVSMKSLLQAGWLLSVAFGNLIVVIIKGSRPFERQVYEIFLYAVLMAVVITIFAVMTLFYKYVDIPEEEDTDGALPLEEKAGNVNSAYKEDEK